MMKGHHGGEYKGRTRIDKAQQKVEFASLDDFLVDIADSQVQVVRVDVFEDIRQSELSFVYYVSLTMYVTAYDSTGYLLYEYRESIATITTADRTFQDDTFREMAERRRQEVTQRFLHENKTVKRGRFVMSGYSTSPTLVGSTLDAPLPSNPQAH